MPLDAVCISAIAGELRSRITGARVDKIFQPERDAVVLNLHTASGNSKLLISASSGSARISLTTAQMDNPQQPPMFCMLLRKHIAGGRITAVNQPDMERIVELELDCRDDMGFPATKRLIVELMGKWSNIVLVDEENRILDCIHKSSGAVSAMRSLLPGLFYHYPDPQEKADLIAMSDDAIGELISNRDRDIVCEKWMMDTFLGISPLISRECAHVSETTGIYLTETTDDQRERMRDFTVSLRERISSGSFTPFMLLEEGVPRDFTFMEIEQYGSAYEGRVFESFSVMLETYYREKDRADSVRRRGHDVIRTMTNARDRLRRKVMNQKKELSASMDREYLRVCGDIITSNLHNMERGMNSLETVNYYDPECKMIKIKLDPLKTPQQNAARYYRDYNKAKTAQVMLTEQIALGERELEYVESVLDALSRADGELTVGEIRRELEQNGYLKKLPGKKQMKQQKVSAPMEFISSSGLRILVGKNNSQNDILTLKTAFKSDMWFHVQKIHGSHVILFTNGTQPDEVSIIQAAKLAALYSQARDSENVPVDYTAVKNVKKPNSARPGMVIYDSYKTIYVTPDSELAEKLKK